MNLENLGLAELNAQEVQEVEGGGRWLKYLDRVITAIGVYDAISDFNEGWNSVPSHGNRGSGGSW